MVWAKSIFLLMLILMIFGIPTAYAGHQFATPEPIFGEQRTVVILIEFPDAKHVNERSKEFIKRMLFTEGSRYLLEDSYGLTGPLVPSGITGGVTDWITLPHPFSYYSPIGGVGYNRIRGVQKSTNTAFPLIFFGQPFSPYPQTHLPYPLKGLQA